MRKTFVSLITLILCYLPTSMTNAQISFGFKAGLNFPINLAPIKGNYEPYNASKNSVGENGEVTITQLARNIESLNGVLNSLPIGFEVGPYISRPISLKGRIRIELTIEQMDLRMKFRALFAEGFQFMDNAELSDLTLLDPAMVISDFKGRQSKLSVHYHYYFTRELALSIGASVGRLFGAANIKGRLLIDGYETANNANYFFSSEDFEVRPKWDQASTFALHLGLLLRLGGGPKGEIRFSAYGLPVNETQAVSGTASFQGLSEQVRYSIPFSYPRRLVISMFIEI